MKHCEFENDSTIQPVLPWWCLKGHLPPRHHLQDSILLKNNNQPPGNKQGSSVLGGSDPTEVISSSPQSGWSSPHLPTPPLSRPMWPRNILGQFYNITLPRDLNPFVWYWFSFILLNSNPYFTFQKILGPNIANIHSPTHECVPLAHQGGEGTRQHCCMECTYVAIQCTRIHFRRMNM